MPGRSAEIEVYNESGMDLPINPGQIRQISSLVEQQESCTFALLEIVYVNEEEIIRINAEYLGHHYVTDTITFRYDDSGETRQHIEGTVYCCARRIFEQAQELNEPPEREFRRIAIHGLLHLAGYDDRSPEDKKAMAARENFYLKLSVGV